MGTDNKNIKIKINGEEKAFQEKKELNKDLVVYDWKSKREVAATEEKATNMRAAFEIIKKKPKRKVTITKNRAKILSKSDKYSPTMLIISTISAIVIGVLIGMVLLGLMVKESNGEKHSSNQPSNGLIASGNEDVLLPSADLFILQQGVYQKEDSVKKLEAELEGKGLPFAYIKDGDKIRVFVAVSDATETGKQLKESTLFQKSFAETFPTAVKVPDKSIPNLTGDEKKLLESVYPFYEKLVKESSLAFIQGDNYSVPDDFLKTEINQMKALKDIQQKPIKELQQSLLNAHEELVSFFNTKKDEQWLHVQKHLLTFVANYFML